MVPGWQPAAHGVKVKRGQLVFGHHKAGGGSIVLLAGIASGNNATLDDGPQGRHGLQRYIGADALVAGKAQGIALFLGDGDFHQLVGKAAGLPGGGGAAMALHRIGVGVFAADGAVAGDVFRRLDHA
jgi:hypothetical protein